MKFSTSFFTALALVGTVALTSCEDLPLKEPGAKTFDLDQFEANINNRLAGNTVGYAYSISHDGIQVRQGSGGDAVATWDLAGGIDHSHTKRQDIASVTKTITALAAMRWLKRQATNENTTVAQFIPDHWERNSNIHELTLGQLMTHMSGIPSNAGISHTAMKNLVEADTNVTPGNYQYANPNYAMMRVVIAHMFDIVGMNELSAQVVSGEKTEADLEAAIADNYIKACNYWVFEKAGIRWTEPKPDGESNPTLNYNATDNSPGWNKGDMTLWAGFAGWRLSAEELNAIIAHAKYTDDIINEEFRNRMKDNLIGYSPNASMEVEGGMCYGHGGFHRDRINPNAGADLGRGCFTVLIQFPYNYEVAVVSNSIGITNNMEGEVIPAWNNAFIDP